MKVYRLQHSVSGKGPYAEQCNLGYSLDLLCTRMNSKNCPEPDKDLALQLNFRDKFPNCYCISSNIRGVYIFGFTNEDQLKKWFGSKGIKRLVDEYGFEVVIKEIDDSDVIRGETQCMINAITWFNSKTIDNWTPNHPTHIAIT